MRIRLLSISALGLALFLLISSGSALAQEQVPEQCWACHRQPNLETVAGVQAANALCLDCHEEAGLSQELDGKTIPLQVQEEVYIQSRHGQVACTQCHSTVARSPHQEQLPLACGDCHHNLSQHIATGDAHLTVECSACHFEPEAVTQDDASGIVRLSALDEQGNVLDRTSHQMTMPVDCGRCHSPGNEVGAAYAALPPKGLLCFACHDASPVLYAGHLGSATSPLRTDWVSAPALLAFCIGMALASSVWLSGKVHGRGDLSVLEKLSYIVADACRVIFSRRIFTLLKHLVVDGLLLRRTLRESVGRWLMHGLILWPFLARCLLGIFTWGIAQFWPTASLTRTLVDKNAAPVAFIYDFLALLVVCGALWALLRRALDPQMRKVTRGGDVAITALLGAIFAFGFIVEGARLIVTQVPPAQAIYSFGGYAVSLLLRLIPINWASVYAYLWWVHAALVAAFVAYLPFSKLFHLLAGPLLLTIRGLARNEE
ncbi:MAG: cytochrome c3 family protein [Anaerolineae bacterium]|nr:cytochrome c3 family protein [Anaerolineae bacterium]